MIGGYFFSPKLTGEVGYFDYGKAKASIPGLSGDIASSAWGIGVAVHQDLAVDWDLFAQLELYWDTIRTKYSKDGLDESASLNMFSVGVVVQVLTKGSVARSTRR